MASHCCCGIPTPGTCCELLPETLVATFTAYDSGGTPGAGDCSCIDGLTVTLSYFPYDGSPSADVHNWEGSVASDLCGSSMYLVARTGSDGCDWDVDVLCDGGGAVLRNLVIGGIPANPYSCSPFMLEFPLIDTTQLYYCGCGPVVIPSGDHVTLTLTEGP